LVNLHSFGLVASLVNTLAKWSPCATDAHIKPLASAELNQVLLKDVKSKRGKNERGRSCSQIKKHSSGYISVAVKSRGDISAEPASGQNIEEHVVTDLDLRNDENRPSSTSSAVAEEC